MSDNQKPWQRAQADPALQDTIESYPFIQWVNRGDLLDPPQDRGGFAMPGGQESLIDGDYAILGHSNGATTDVLFTQALALAVIAYRFAWVKDGTRLAEYTEGARGRIQALCFTTDQDDVILGPLVLTVKGTTSKDLSGILRAHRSDVRKLTNGKAPGWFFWTRLQAGEPTMVGSKARSLATPLEPAAGVTEEDFIGQEVVKRINAHANEISRWAGAWKAAGANGEDDPSTAPHPETEAGPATGKMTPLGEALAMAMPVTQRYGQGATLQAPYQAQDREVLSWLANNTSSSDLSGAAKLLLAELEPATEVPF